MAVYDEQQGLGEQSPNPGEPSSGRPPTKQTDINGILNGSNTSKVSKELAKQEKSGNTAADKVSKDDAGSRTQRFLRNRAAGGSIPETLFSFRKGGKDEKGKAAKKPAKHKYKKKKKAALFSGLLGVIMIIGIFVFIFSLGSLKIPHLMANIGTYEFARVTRNFGSSVSEVTEEKLAVDADNTFAKSLQAKWGTLKSSVTDRASSIRESTWGKLDKYRPQKVLENMESDKTLEYVFTDEKRLILPGTKQVLTGVKINGTLLEPKDAEWGKYFTNRADRLEFSGRLQAQVESALGESGPLVRGSVGNAIRDEMGVKLSRWEKLTKSYRNAKEAEAAEIKATYEKTNTAPSDTPAVSAVADTEESVKKATDACIADETCLEEVAADDTAAFKKTISAKVGASLSESTLAKIAGGISTIYKVALPMCMIYESSVTASGPTVDANAAEAQKTYWTLASAADQQKNGTTPGGAPLSAAQVGGLDDEVGNIANAPSELRASGKLSSTANFSNPEASQSSEYTIADALFGGTLGGIFDKFFRNSCPTITTPETGAIIAGSEIAIKTALFLVPAGGEVGNGTIEGLESAAETSIISTIKGIVSRTFSREGYELVKDGATDFLKQTAKDASLIVGGSYLAKMFVLTRMGNMSSPIPSSADLAVHADQGGNIAANSLCRQQLYCRPLTAEETAMSNFQDSQDIAFANSQKSVFERYLSPHNPTSTLANTAVALNTTFEQPITTLMHSLVTKIGSIFQPDSGLFSVFFSGTQKKAMAATTNNNYNIIQWGWTQAEENLIESNPDIYSPINNAQAIESEEGKLASLQSSYDKCFTESIGTLLANGDIQREEDGTIKADGGTCSPNNLGSGNKDAFAYRIYMRNRATLDQLNDMQNPTADDDGSGGDSGTPAGGTGNATPINAPGLNGYTIPCGGQPAAVPRLAGPRADWSGVKDSGTIGTNSGGQPIKVYIRNACDTTNAKTVFIVGGIHGSENGGQLVAWELLFNAQLPSNVRVIAVPELNGTGIAGNTRKNSDGVDLNRNEDFNWGGGSPESCSESDQSCRFYKGASPGSEPETKAIDSFLLSVGKVNLFAIYHDNLNYVAPVGTTPVNIGNIYAKDVGMTGQGTGVVGKTKTVTQHGSLDGWYNSQTGSPSLLIELGNDQSAGVINQHVNAIQQMLQDGTI